MKQVSLIHDAYDKHFTSKYYSETYVAKPKAVEKLGIAAIYYFVDSPVLEQEHSVTVHTYQFFWQQF